MVRILGLRHSILFKAFAVAAIWQPLNSLALAEAVRCESIFATTGVKAESATAPKVDTRSFDNLTKYEQAFTTNRGLYYYRLTLGDNFSRAFDNMLKKPNPHWFDSGAGEAYAVKQALNMAEAKKLKSTIVAYETSAKELSNMKVLSGRFIENIPDAEIPMSDLITDVFGPMAYSGQPHVVLQKYVNRLKPDGEIHIYLGAKHELFGETNEVVTAKGEVLSFGDWLSQIPGLKTQLVKIRKEDDGHFYEMWTLQIKKAKEDIQVPAVEVVTFKEGAPPQMTFREVLRGNALQLNALQTEARKNYFERNKDVTATHFLNLFRGGEITHPLISSIKKLKSGEVWVNVSDFGEQIFSGMKKKDYDFSDSSVYYSLSQKIIQWRAKGINTDKFKYASFAGVRDIDGIKNLKLITDFYGDFVTSMNPDAVLRSYVNAIHDKGEIYLLLGTEEGGFGTQSTVLTKEGKEVSLRRWVESIPGLDIKMYRSGFPYIKNGEWTILKIKIEDRSAIKIPEIEVIGVKKIDGLPVGFFEER